MDTVGLYPREWRWPDAAEGYQIQTSHQSHVLNDGRHLFIGRVAYRRPAQANAEQQFQFIRITVPQLVTLLCDCLPTAVVDVIVDYYGDVTRLLGAEWRPPTTRHMYYHGNDTIRYDHVHRQLTFGHFGHPKHHVLPLIGLGPLYLFGSKCKPYGFYIHQQH